ncbi:MAG: radical SAM protein, partial [Candidatus Marinimicrobia bacterium]|nr:radical SAM protein [Candidatus Neomarinimicrobiota bacterium]
PVEASIEVTTRCNLACTMCPRQLINRPLQEMEFSLFKKIIGEMKDFAELVYLHGLGEPLLCSQLFKFLKYAKSQKLRVGISTNATLLDQAQSEKLLDSGLDYLILALDGATKKTYEQIRVGGNFAKVETNIKNFLAMKKRRKKSPFTVIQFITMKENEKEVGLFLEKWRHSGAEAVRVKPVVDFFGQRKPKRTNAPSRCFYPYRMINIYFDGTVVPCCEDNFGNYALGNIKEKSLREIWNGPKIQLLRRKLAARKREETSLCRQCRYPQPSTWGILGVTLFDNLKVKKILPFLERLPVFRERMIVYD